MGIPLPRWTGPVEDLRLNDKFVASDDVVLSAIANEGGVSVVVRCSNGMTSIRNYTLGDEVTVQRWVEPVYAGSKQDRLDR